VLSGNRPVNVILVLFGIHACQRRPWSLFWIALLVRT